MFIEYDEYMLLELFENEPIYLSNEETGIVMYVKEDDFGFKVILTISTYERECNLSLDYCNFSNPVFEGNFKNVGKIIVLDNELKIVYSEEDTIAVSLSFKPNIVILANDK